MTTITATTILSSALAQVPGKRLTTLLLRYPRCIHAEFMTHRMFSRNAASSRAIPVKKLIQDVLDDPFIPLVWGKNQKGMQAYEEVAGDELVEAKRIWSQAMRAALSVAESLEKVGAHKQLVNRLLEPFSHITVLVSATEWTNFLALRDHPAAEPHIQRLALEIKAELGKPAMQILEPGEWHLPFASGIIGAEGNPWDGIFDLEDRIRMSSACCASTSYKTVDGFDMDPDRAGAIFDNLVKGDVLHASPFEHVAQADTFFVDPHQEGNWLRPEQHRNFVGFRQYRAMLPNDTL